MAPQRKAGGVIKHGPLQAAIVEKEAARLDQLDPDAKASGEAQQSTGILRYVRLK